MTCKTIFFINHLDHTFIYWTKCFINKKTLKLN